MKKLLSLPPNLVDCFHDIENVSPKEWFCTSDPVGCRLGSGGGTTWLLEACRKADADMLPMEDWLSCEKRILLHAGGQSRRLPGYAPSGKILTPIPVFRWMRGQKLGQNLLSLQLPLYESIMQKAPESLHTLVASGDVYVRNNEALQAIPAADVVCYGLWVDPSLATNHGVFFSHRQRPESLDFMLQKPSLEQLGRLADTHLFLMDIGIWLLSDKAVSLLMKRSYEADGKTRRNYDLYADFGRTLGCHPTLADEELSQLTVAILPLPGGEFYHYGTNRELISSTLAVQNLVRDQRTIMHRKVKPHPAMFVQNATVDIPLTAANANLWVENSHVGRQWTLGSEHILSGVPHNAWKLCLPAGTCLDVVPIGEAEWAVRPYGFTDVFKGTAAERSTLFMGKPLCEWAAERGIVLESGVDIQELPLFPLCKSVDEMGEVLRFMIEDAAHAEGKRLYAAAECLSASDLSERANLRRLYAQRQRFREANWASLAANHAQSVFYQLDLDDAARAFAAASLPLPPSLGTEVGLLKRIHDEMFRARTLQLAQKDGGNHRAAAFSLLQEGLIQRIKEHKQTPRMSVFQDQIVWGRSPVRIDFAGGWTDTPPFCLYAGGSVVNAAIELNGQPPLQVYVKPSKVPRIVLRSIDLGEREEIGSWDELRTFNAVRSPFSIPKAALALAGFLPEFAAERHDSLEKQLQAFGGGIEVSLLAAIPAGSGLGTSSILAATVLGAVADFCGLAWDKNEIGNRALVLEQLLTSGGGWQDQYGGILNGLKLLHTKEGFSQQPLVRWLPEQLFTEPTHRACHLLYYTGITRTAKDILAEIVQGMFLNDGARLRMLTEMKAHSLDMFETILRGDFEGYGRLVGKSWEQNKALDAGTNPPGVQKIIERIGDYCLGYKLPGAGGGGYLYMVAKDPEAALRIRKVLTDCPPFPNARFVGMSLSAAGLQVSRS